MKMNVIIVDIEHRFGHNLHAFLTWEEVDKYLHDYVQKNWREEWGTIPEDRDEAIEAYFNDDAEPYTDDYYRTESCDLTLPASINMLSAMTAELSAKQQSK